MSTLIAQSKLPFSLRYQQTLKQSCKQLEEVVLSKLQNGVLDDDINARLRIYHVSHQLSRSGMKHHRKYDTNKYNGFTVGIVSAGNNTYMWSAYCEKEDQYNRAEGRAVLLTKISKHILSLEDTNVFSDIVYEPTVVDEPEAFKYFYKDDEYTMTSAQETRALIDWYIRTQINVSKPKQILMITRDYLQNIEATTSALLNKTLPADYRIIYNYPDSETTNLKVVLSKTPFNNSISEQDTKNIEKVLESLNVTVLRYKGDPDNRLHARYFALKKLLQKIKKFNHKNAKPLETV